MKTSKMVKRAFVAALFGGALLQGARGFGASAVKVEVDPSKPGVVIPEDYLGLSMETIQMLPDENGKYFFSAENKALVAMFKQLGIKNLRVGGNTSDIADIKIPNEKDIDSLFAFAKAADVKVIYTLRLLKNPDAAALEQGTKDAAKLAKYIFDHYRDQFVCFAIGNEPNVYAKEYPVYKGLLTKYLAAIDQPGIAPGAKFCGPSTTPSKGEWARDLAKDYGANGPIRLITQHFYFGGSGRKVTDPLVGREAMLSTKWIESYEKAYNVFVPAALENKLPYRIEETNNYFNGGTENVSNTWASSVWGIDYLHWWAQHQASGMNFHTGDKVAAGGSLAPCWYAQFWTSPQGYNVHPIGYATKAFQVAGHGAYVPAKVESADGVNLTAYAVLAPDNSVYVTLVNKEHGTAPKGASVTLSVPAKSSAETMTLKQEKNDLAATSGVTLGGAAIQDDATWDGKWTPLSGANGQYTVELPAAQAVIVHLR